MQVITDLNILLITWVGYGAKQKVGEVFKRNWFRFSAGHLSPCQQRKYYTVIKVFLDISKA